MGLKDEFYNRYIVRDNLLAPIVKAFVANGRRYNLLNSAIIELFEYLRVVSVGFNITTNTRLYQPNCTGFSLNGASIEGK